MTNFNNTLAKDIKIGDRVRGVEHNCRGNAYACSEANCKKFGGLVINIVQDQIVLKDRTPIKTRWVQKVYPEIQREEEAQSVLSNFVRPRKSPE